MEPKRRLRVRNWERFQHYKQRNPPWIKLYRALLLDPDFVELPDATKGHLVGIWLLAAGTIDGSIPFDNGIIKNLLHARETVDLELLVSLGFLEILTSSVVLAPERMLRREETETEG